ncbi:MAG: shikimate dehydrogenase [Candidatus Aureabacteria bacterium]|nr:shikimate dehydrogenase [Candidatus Auribacterota bacterium]
MRSMQISGDFSLYGIVGCPIKHTASPAMHNCLFNHDSIRAVYIPIELKKTQLKIFFETAKFLFSGLNVTVPYKKDVISYIDLLDKHALRMNSVNTVKRENDVLKGYNTDFIGLHKALKGNFSLSLKGKDVCILGAGGAASSALYLALQENARNIVIVNRTLKKAVLLASSFKGTGDKIFTAKKDSRKASDYINGSQIIINATSLGLKKKDPMPLKKKDLTKKQYIFDMIYNPADTKLIASAKEKGCKAANGLDMLLYQGAESYRIWTGKTPDISLMRKAVKKIIY